jgi:large-conductance mechanosensitive channel
MEPIYDPVEFVNKGNIFTLAVIGSFITYKLCNSLYTNLYEPIIDTVVDNESASSYYVKIGKHHVQLDIIFKEIIKWIIIVIFLMVIYNIIIKKKLKK